MHAALRPHITTGVALLGAGVIAVTPLAPSPPDVRIAEIPIANPAVQLTAAPDPREFYPQVLQKAVGNTQILLQQYQSAGAAYIGALIADPIPVLRSTALYSVLVFVPPISFAVVALASTPVANGFGATQAALKDVSDAVAAANPTDLVNALVDIPARILDGFLNGGYPFQGSSGSGLLTPYTPFEESGPLAFPLLIADLIVSSTKQSPPAPPTTLSEVGTDITDPASQEVTADTDGRVLERQLSRPLSVVTKHINDVADAVNSVLPQQRSTVTSADSVDVSQTADGPTPKTPIRDAVRKADRAIEKAEGAAGVTRKTPIRDAVKKGNGDISNTVTKTGSRPKEAPNGGNHRKAGTGDT